MVLIVQLIVIAYVGIVVFSIVRKEANASQIYLNILTRIVPSVFEVTTWNALTYPHAVILVPCVITGFLDSVNNRNIRSVHQITILRCA